MSLTKHDVWEMSKTVSCFFAGDVSLKDAMEDVVARQKAATPEERTALHEYTALLEGQITALQVKVAATVDSIILLEELPESISMWRTADLTKYLGATQQYDIDELLVAAILVQPNVGLLFDRVEPAYDE